MKILPAVRARIKIAGMRCRVVYAALLILLVAGIICLGRQGIVTTNSGRTLTGDIRQSGDQTIVRVDGVDVVLDKSDITSMRYLPSVEDQYFQRLAKLEPRDVNGRIELSRWAFDHNRYGLAEDAIDQALRIDPKNQDAAQFQAVIIGQRRMEAAKAEQPATAPVKRLVTSKPAQNQPPARNEINRIRQSLLKPADTHTILSFQNDVLRRYARSMNIPWEQFNQEPRLTQALQIIHDPDQGFRPDVRVMSDPPAIVEFRLRILPMIVNGCASTGCHGSGGAGDFRLLSSVRDQAQVYAQFDQLRRYIKTIQSDSHSPFAAPDQRMMLDAENPEQSILLQYALPADKAQMPHPAVKHWKPLVVDKTDPRYQELFNWVSELGGQ